MKKNLLIIAWVLGFACAAQAQGPGHREGRGEKRAQMQEMKETYITEALNLSDAEKEKFWPLYEAYDSARKDLRRDIMALGKGRLAKTDKELEADLEQYFVLRAKEVAVEKQYMQQFQDMISIRQVAALQQAENQIKGAMIRHMGGGGKGGGNRQN